MRRFASVKVFRNKGQQRIVADRIYDDWLCVEKFRASSFRDRVNMALLREAIEARSTLTDPCIVFDLFALDLFKGGEDDEVDGFLLAVDPGIDLDMVDDFVGTLESGNVSDEGMAEALEEEILRRWRAADVYTRLVWLDQVGIHPEAVLQQHPPGDVADLIENTIT